jgi:signal transduction histidine kinase
VQGESVWLEVSDNGCGMPEDVKKRIFEPFYTTKPVGKGTGLGLSITWEIVQRHHGHIDVTSAPGAGTTFRLTLPIKHAEH